MGQTTSATPTGRRLFCVAVFLSQYPGDPDGPVDRIRRAVTDAGSDHAVIVRTADHGELFGEMGYFGHGPIMHEKCFEVPYLEGMIR